MSRVSDVNRVLGKIIANSEERDKLINELLRTCSRAIETLEKQLKELS